MYFILYRLSLQEFRYLGRQHITKEIAENNRDNVQPNSTANTKKSMTLPARMQPPFEFNEETTANLNCQPQLTLISNGTSSIGRVENSKKGFNSNI